MEGFYLGFGVFSSVFFIIGAVFLFYGMNHSRSSKNWKITSGVIVKKEKITSPTLSKLFQGSNFLQNAPDRYPTVEYEVNGQTYTYTSKISQEPGLPPGKKVEVLYDPNKPDKALINTFVQRGGFFKLIGTLFFTIGSISYVILFIVFFSQ